MFEISKMSRKIGASVVGLGGNGMKTVHNAIESEHIDKLVCVDIDAQKCQKARELSGVLVTTSLEEVLADPAIELVYISTHNAAHYPVGKSALERGKKVFMEKPMGVNIEQTEDLLKTVSRTSGWLSIGFECRHYSKLYARIKEILDSREIGTLRHINCQYVLPPDIESEWRHNSDLSGGIFCEKLCHYVDLPRWWVGDRVCRYFAAKADNVVPHYEVADNIELTYQFDCGVVSHLSFIVGAAARVAKYADMDDLIKKQNESGYELSYRLVGTEGAIESDIYARELKIYHHAGKPGFVGMADLAWVERWGVADTQKYVHNTADEKKDVAARIINGLPPIIDPEDAAETMRLCFAFEEAASKSWQVVER